MNSRPRSCLRSAEGAKRRKSQGRGVGSGGGRPHLHQHALNRLECSGGGGGGEGGGKGERRGCRQVGRKGEVKLGVGYANMQPVRLAIY